MSELFGIVELVRYRTLSGGCDGDIVHASRAKRPKLANTLNGEMHICHEAAIQWAASDPWRLDLGKRVGAHPNPVDDGAAMVVRARDDV